MIASIFHKGSGIGNQLARYVMTRVLALDKGYYYGMCFPENFKAGFMDLDMGIPVSALQHEFQEKKVLKDGNDIRPYDWEGLLTIKDFTLIDGEFQGEKYYEHHMDKIRDWLKVELMDMPDNLCVIGFRGGEYVGVKDLFLPKEYWMKAVKMMEEKYPNINFQVVTDDVETANDMFDFLTCHITHDIGQDWRAVRYAKHLIIANSSFYILPALLNEDVEEVIAPLYWAGYNKGYWQLEQNQYKKFSYIHHDS